MMDTYQIALIMAGGTALGVVVWLLAKLGKALIKIAEALAAAAVVLFAMWLVIKAVVWALRQVVTHWRTSLMGTQSRERGVSRFQDWGRWVMTVATPSVHSGPERIPRLRSAGAGLICRCSDGRAGEFY
jgi:S-DNA-T family DNA segregation ATPase FtsK/SpoIIIE